MQVWFIPLADERVVRR